MLCLEGTGALSHVSLRHQPDIFNEPCVFAAVCVKGEPNRGARRSRARCRAGRGSASRTPATAPGARPGACPGSAARASAARFPFGTVTLDDDERSPEGRDHGLEPVRGRAIADSSSLPVAALEYRLTNPSRAAPLTGVFSWNARNFMAVEKAEKAVRAVPGGFVLWARRPEGEAVGRGRLLRRGRTSPRPGSTTPGSGAAGSTT